MINAQLCHRVSFLGLQLLALVSDGRAAGGLSSILWSANVAYYLSSHYPQALLQFHPMPRQTAVCDSGLELLLAISNRFPVSTLYACCVLLWDHLCFPCLPCLDQHNRTD